LFCNPIRSVRTIWQTDEWKLAVQLVVVEVQVSPACGIVEIGDATRKSIEVERNNSHIVHRESSVGMVPEKNLLYPQTQFFGASMNQFPATALSPQVQEPRMATRVNRVTKRTV
jgi:hypothetical protein